MSAKFCKKSLSVSLFLRFNQVLLHHLPTTQDRDFILFCATHAPSPHPPHHTVRNMASPMALAFPRCDSASTSPPRRRRPSRVLTLAVVAMARKAASAPMQVILAALAREGVAVNIVGEDVLLRAPVGDWPRADAVLAFYSQGFPLEKVAEYARGAVSVNDIGMQRVLLDRGRVRSVLERIGVRKPRGVVVREGDRVRLMGEELEVGGVKMRKPFVEKPLDAEDHNVYVYYKGGGVRRLFRKRGGLSSVWEGSWGGEIRGGGGVGGYMYEEFCDSSVDVKVYAVAGEYFHAEERKAPTVDGRVERGADGREVRRKVELSAEEEGFCRALCTAFRQFVVGFDIVRGADGRSYVIDVNGWSFVKGDPRFGEVCGGMIARFLEDQSEMSVGDGSDGETACISENSGESDEEEVWKA